MWRPSAGEERRIIERDVASANRRRFGGVAKALWRRSESISKTGGVGKISNHGGGEAIEA
jgi:hypothetical protein